MSSSTRIFPLFFLVIAFCGRLSAQEGPASTEAEFEKQYQERIKMEKLSNVYIPKNLDDALTQLDKLTSPESRLKFKSIPEDSVCRYMHGRLGQWIILNWGFYGGSRLSHYLRSAGITYPDDMADFLILAYHRKLNGKPVEIRDLAISFREKRKKEFREDKKKGKVIYEETHKKNRP
ncbi:MAG: DUF6794 domain-containing protein, partial [Saprospiraceae bacterium]